MNGESPEQSAVVETRAKTEAETGTRTKRMPPYHVVILNDEDHTFDYVIEILLKLFKHPRPRAEELTWRIHNDGRAVVFTTHKELAELKRDQVITFGPDPWVEVDPGPLGCVVEPAPAD